MKVSLSGDVIFEKVYNSIILKTKDGESMAICMRDSGFEFKYQDEWYEAKDGIVSKMIVYPTVISHTQTFVEWGTGLDNKRTDYITTTPGSLILIGAGVWQWDECLADRSCPYDNKSNSWYQLYSPSHSKNWPTSGNAIWENNNGYRGVNHAFIKDFELGSEVTLSVLEILNAGSRSNYTIGYLTNSDEFVETKANGPGLLVMYVYLDWYAKNETVANGDWKLVHEYRATEKSIHQAVFVKQVSKPGFYQFKIDGDIKGATTNSFFISAK